MLDQINPQEFYRAEGRRPAAERAPAEQQELAMGRFQSSTL
jgi:hypothetical protein